MPRRRRETSTVVLCAQFAGLLLLLALAVPGARQIIPAIGILVLGLIGIALLLFIICTLVSRASRLESKSNLPSSHASFPPLSQANCVTPPVRKSLIDQVRSLDWYQFEKIIGTAYRKSGYAIDSRGGANPDGGIDIILTSPTGERIAVQCKHWKTWNVGVKVVREFLGALTHAGIQSGVIITLQGCTAEAKRFADQHRIQILDETDISDLLEKVDAKYDPEFQAMLDDTRKFCPRCESEMILRTNKSGRNPGSHFWGCSAFPRCRFTLPA